MAKKKTGGKQVSARELGTLLGVQRHTVVDWAERWGLPAVQEADRDSGQSWIFDVADVFEWYRQRGVDEAMQQVAGVDGGREGDEAVALTKEEANRRKDVAQMVMAEIQADEARERVISVEDVAGIVNQEYAEVRSQLMAVPSKVAPHAAATSKPTEVQDIVESAINDALEGLRHDQHANGSNDAEGG
jgi:phage terminase Nu1 subunit (DNA packaging protein)